MTPNRKVVTAAEMQSIEQRWFDSGEITLEGMMDKVGRAIADWVLADLGPDAGGKNVLALVGKGNNGGDALVAGKYLLKAGVRTTAAVVIARAGDDPPMDQFVEAGGNVVELQSLATVREMSKLMRQKRPDSRWSLWIQHLTPHRRTNFVSFRGRKIERKEDRRDRSTQRCKSGYWRVRP